MAVKLLEQDPGMAAWLYSMAPKLYAAPLIYISPDGQAYAELIRLVEEGHSRVAVKDYLTEGGGYVVEVPAIGEVPIMGVGLWDAPRDGALLFVKEFEGPLYLPPAGGNILLLIGNPAVHNT